MLAHTSSVAIKYVSGAVAKVVFTCKTKTRNKLKLACDFLFFGSFELAEYSPKLPKTSFFVLVLHVGTSRSAFEIKR